MIPLKLNAIISKSGKLMFLDTDLLRGWLSHYPGKEIQVTFDTRKQSKSTQQLGYLFGHVVPAIAGYTGYSDEEVYGILKKQFLTRNLGEENEYVASLSELDKASTTKFISQCVEFGLNLGAEIYPSDMYGG
jgi:hypothetical protein